MGVLQKEHTSHGCAVHDLKFGDGLALVVLIRRRARRLPPYDRQLHVLDLYADEQEVDLADDDVLQVISALPKVSTAKRRRCRYALGFVVLELNVQAVFDPNLHFNGIIAIWRHAEGMDPYVLVLRDVGHPPRYCDPHKVPAHQTPRRSAIDSELGRDA